MLFIHKKLINKLTAPYAEQDMLTCYATAESLSAYTSRAILLVDHNKLVMLFLNFFSSKVVHTIEFEISELQSHRYKNGSFLSVVWSFQSRGQTWRFRMVRKMLTLGTMQGDFLDFLQQHIIHEEPS